MTTLVTGGSGFVGLNVAEALLARGENVVLFDPATPPPAALAGWALLPGRVTAVPGDVRDGDAVRRALAVPGVDRVVHAAAITANAERERRAAREIVDVNVLGTLGVVDGVRRRPVRRLIVLSSVAVYGHVEPEQGPIDEVATCPRPATLYGISKYAAEAAALRADELDPLNLVVARLGPVFGPWEHETGVRDTPSPQLQVSRLAAAGRPAILTHEGTADWLYSRDAAAGLAGLLMVDRPRHRVYHVGAGQRWPVTAWCERLAAAVPGFRWEIAAPQEAVNVRFQPARPRAALGIARLIEELGYRPRYDVDAAFADFESWRRRTPGALGDAHPGGAS